MIINIPLLESISGASSKRSLGYQGIRLPYGCGCQVPFRWYYEIINLQLVSFIGRSSWHPFLIGSTVIPLFTPHRVDTISQVPKRILWTFYSTTNTLGYAISSRSGLFATTLLVMHDVSLMSQPRRSLDGTICLCLTEWWRWWQNLGVVILVVHHRTSILDALLPITTILIIIEAVLSNMTYQSIL